ncbi:hypothetical protein GX51_06925 [Blastomyces parvus]|uniref:Uncharacterized protein n=1 Tax=Blastomyces parvus TaxID=2060905 RepID=A0A2B7WN74_9EURO|nr:hypothetical protein GX51_06925 [Blastomyces parvus]
MDNRRSRTMGPLLYLLIVKDLKNRPGSFSMCLTVFAGRIEPAAVAVKSKWFESVRFLKRADYRVVKVAISCRLGLAHRFVGEAVEIERTGERQAPRSTESHHLQGEVSKSELLAALGDRILKVRASFRNPLEDDDGAARARSNGFDHGSLVMKKSGTSSLGHRSKVNVLMRLVLILLLQPVEIGLYSQGYNKLSKAQARV